MKPATVVVDPRLPDPRRRPLVLEGAGDGANEPGVEDQSGLTRQSVGRVDVQGVVVEILARRRLELALGLPLAEHVQNGRHLRFGIAGIGDDRGQIRVRSRRRFFFLGSLEGCDQVLRQTIAERGFVIALDQRHVVHRDQPGANALGEALLDAPEPEAVGEVTAKVERLSVRQRVVRRIVVVVRSHVIRVRRGDPAGARVLCLGTYCSSRYCPVHSSSPLPPSSTKHGLVPVKVTGSQVYAFLSRYGILA